MKKAVIFLLLAIVLLYDRVMAEQTEIMRQVQKKEPPRLAEEVQDKIYAHSDYEYSWIKQGAKEGNWRVFSNRLAYLKDGMQVFYLDSTGYARFGVRDYTLDAGSYIRLPNGYIHGEIGSATDHVNYIYKFKGLIEAEQRIVNNWFVNFETTYLHHTSEQSGDVYVFNPSLVRYFGNNYISAGYGLSFTEHRDSAQFATLKGSFALNDRVNLWLGTAVGERLFDIDLLKASKQYGSIFFGGTDITITKNVTLRIGGSYSKERPSFIKRSVEWAAKVKF